MYKNAIEYTNIVTIIQLQMPEKMFFTMYKM